jgi:hypothetical protein
MDFSNCFEASTQIGRVRFNDESSCIFIQVHPHYEYDIDLERCRTAEQALDWIHQVCIDKNWGKEVSNDLLRMMFIVIPSTLWSGKA